MPLLSNQTRNVVYLTPITSVGKFALRVTDPEQFTDPEVYQRMLPKTGEVVHERRFDTISGKVVGFDVQIPKDRNFDSQYRVRITNADTPDMEAALVVSVNSSLGRQLVNQMLTLSEDDLADDLTFSFRVIERDGQKRGYLNLYRGHLATRERAVARRYGLEEIPAPLEKRNKTKGNVVEYDYSPANEFFFEFAGDIQEKVAQANARRLALEGIARTGAAIAAGRSPGGLPAAAALESQSPVGADALEIGDEVKTEANELADADFGAEEDYAKDIPF